MSRSDAALFASARRSYELGRLDRGVRHALLLAPVLFLPVACCAEPVWNVVCGAGLMAAVAYCLWRGEDWSRGVFPGFVSGAVPLLVPLVVHSTGHACEGGHCMMSACCLFAGVGGGLLLGVFAGRLGKALVAAGLVAGLLGSVGCMAYGLVGLAGMAAGMAAGAVPVLVLRRA
jgi:hypothetical protein